MPSDIQPAIQVAIYCADEIPSGLRAELDAWEATQFGHIYKWAPPEWYAAAGIDGHLAGALLIVTREVAAGAESIRVAGIGGVVTRPEHRKKGVATAMLREAANLMRTRLDVDFGFLICRRQIAPVYEKAGWIHVLGPTSFSQPSGTTTYPNDSMVLPLRNRQWPAGPINLRGLPW